MKRSFFFNEVLPMVILLSITYPDIAPANAKAAIKSVSSSKANLFFYIDADAVKLSVYCFLLIN
jgi:hypothetical protein